MLFFLFFSFLSKVYSITDSHSTKTQAKASNMENIFYPLFPLFSFCKVICFDRKKMFGNKKQKKL